MARAVVVVVVVAPTQCWSLLWTTDYHHACAIETMCTCASSRPRYCSALVGALLLGMGGGGSGGAAAVVVATATDGAAWLGEEEPSVPPALLPRAAVMMMMMVVVAAVPGGDSRWCSEWESAVPRTGQQER